MCSIEEDVPTPLCDDVADGLDGKGEQRHRSPQRDHFWAYQWGDFAEEVKVNFQFDRVKRDIYNLQTTYPGWPIDTVTGMPPERLSNAHNDIARFAQGCIHCQIANHACHQPVISIASAKGLFQEFDTQRFDLVDMFGACEPAVHRADMPLGSACAYLSRKERSDRRTGGSFRG